MKLTFSECLYICFNCAICKLVVINGTKKTKHPFVGLICGDELTSTTARSETQWYKNMPSSILCCPSWIHLSHNTVFKKIHFVNANDLWGCINIFIRPILKQKHSQLQHFTRALDLQKSFNTQNEVQKRIAWGILSVKRNLCALLVYTLQMWVALNSVEVQNHWLNELRTQNEYYCTALQGVWTVSTYWTFILSLRDI